MRAGDASGDNLVNVSDFVLLKATFALMCDYPGYDGRADLTGDCVVDASDFTALRRNFGLSGPSPIKGP